MKHIRNVLRMGQGEEITLCDGRGNDYRTVIEAMEKDRVTVRILEAWKNTTEPPLEVTLFQGIPKSDKMEWIIQKCVELGIRTIVPVMTDRTVVRFEGQKDMEAKTARWRKISLEAAKQCNRGWIPTIELPVKFSKALEMAGKDDLRLIPYEEESKTGIKAGLEGFQGTRVSFFIGPEGGFAEKEIEEAVGRGIRPVTLGPRVLRTETAGVVVLAIIMYELGDVGR